MTNALLVIDVQNDCTDGGPFDVGARATFTDLVDRQLYKGQFGDDYSAFGAADGDGVLLASSPSNGPRAESDLARAGAEIVLIEVDPV